jgi:hypothetical protein
MGKHKVLVKQRIQTNIRVLMALIAAVFLFAGSQAFAQTPNNTSDLGNVLKVSPVRSDIEIKQGTSQTLKVTISNLTSAPITLKPITNDFIAGDERGTPALILDEDKYAPTHSLKRFMKPLQNITIEANKARTVDVVISVPKDAQAGGYFGAIRFTPVGADGGGQVNLSGSVASIILVTAPGPAVEKMTITNFDIQQNGKAGSTFSTPDNLQISARFLNAGNIQLGPFGKVSVTQRDNVVYATDFNTESPRDMILPDSARRWEIPLDKIGTFGNYTVSATFTYGTKNQTIEVKKSFWVIPQTLIVAVIVGVIVLIALIAGIWFFLRHYKRRIIRNQDRGGRYRR